MARINILSTDETLFTFEQRSNAQKDKTIPPVECDTHLTSFVVWSKVTSDTKKVTCFCIN